MYGVFIQYTVYITIQHTFYSTYTVYSAQYKVTFIQYTVDSIKYTVYSLQYIVYSEQRAVYSVRYTNKRSLWLSPKENIDYSNNILR